MNAMACLLTQCCQQNVSALDGMLCCTIFSLQYPCSSPPPPQVVKNPAPPARSLAKIEDPAPAPWALEPALLKSL